MLKQEIPPETSGGYLQAKEKSSSESHGRSRVRLLLPHKYFLKNDIKNC